MNIESTRTRILRMAPPSRLRFSPVPSHRSVDPVRLQRIYSPGKLVPIAPGLVYFMDFR